MRGDKRESGWALGLPVDACEPSHLATVSIYWATIVRACYFPQDLDLLMAMSVSTK